MVNIGLPRSKFVLKPNRRPEKWQKIIAFYVKRAMTVFVFRVKSHVCITLLFQYFNIAEVLYHVCKKLF